MRHTVQGKRPCCLGTEVHVTTTWRDHVVMLLLAMERRVEVDYECPQPLSGARGVSDVRGYSVCAAES